LRTFKQIKIYTQDSKRWRSLFICTY